MSRKRYIKPKFFKNCDLGKCSIEARVAFAGLWCLADREGRLEDIPEEIKLEVLPWDECDMDSLLQELADYRSPHTQNGFITRYEVDGVPYLQVNNFAEHQHPHPNEAASLIPPPANFVAKSGQNGASNVKAIASNVKDGQSKPLTLTITKTLTRTGDDAETHVPARVPAHAKENGGGDEEATPSKNGGVILTMEHPLLGDGSGPSDIPPKSPEFLAGFKSLCETVGIVGRIDHERSLFMCLERCVLITDYERQGVDWQSKCGVDRITLSDRTQSLVRWFDNEQEKAEDRQSRNVAPPPTPSIVDDSASRPKKLGDLPLRSDPTWNLIQYPLEWELGEIRWKQEHWDEVDCMGVIDGVLCLVPTPETLRLFNKSHTNWDLKTALSVIEGDSTFCDQVTHFDDVSWQTPTVQQAASR